MRENLTDIEYRLLKTGCPQHLIDQHLSATNKWRKEHPVHIRRKRLYDPYETEPELPVQHASAAFPNDHRDARANQGLVAG